MKVLKLQTFGHFLALLLVALVFNTGVAGPPKENKPSYSPTPTNPGSPGVIPSSNPSYTPTGTSPPAPGTVTTPSIQQTPISTTPGVITSGEYYDTSYFYTEVRLTVELGLDKFRERTRTEAFLLLTNGQVIRGTSILPSPSSRSYIFRFSGTEKRIYKSELVVYEGYRTSTETVDNAHILRYYLRSSVFNKNTSTPVESKQNMNTFDISYTGPIVTGYNTGYTVTGSWCLESNVINPFTAYPDYLKNTGTDGGNLSYYFLTGHDDMKSKLSEVNLLVDLNSSGELTRIPYFMTHNGIPSFHKFELGPGSNHQVDYDEEYSVYVPFTNIKKLGVRYRYRTVGVDFDDWQLRGLAINFVSSRNEEYRIYTRWDLERKFRGNDPAYLNTWWSSSNLKP